MKTAAKCANNVDAICVMTSNINFLTHVIKEAFPDSTLTNCEGSDKSVSMVFKIGARTHRVELASGHLITNNNKSVMHCDLTKPDECPIEWLKEYCGRE